MPRLSDRQSILDDIDEMVKTLAAWDDDEDIDDLVDIRASIASCRYLNLRSFIRKNKSMNEMLWFYDDREFKQVVRMKKDSFLKLLNLISRDDIFGSPNSRHKQAPVWVQLQVVLQRLGSFRFHHESFGYVRRLRHHPRCQILHCLQLNP